MMRNLLLFFPLLATLQSFGQAYSFSVHPPCESDGSCGINTYFPFVDVNGKPISLDAREYELVDNYCCVIDGDGNCIPGSWYFCGQYWSLVRSFQIDYSQIDTDCFSDEFISWGPSSSDPLVSQSILGTPAGAYCSNDTLSFNAYHKIYDSYVWQYKTATGSWTTLSVTNDPKIELRIEDIFGPNYASHYYEEVYFRFNILGCGETGVAKGPFSFNPINAGVTGSSSLLPKCRDNIDAIIKVTTLTRQLVSGELLTYTVYKPDNTFVAQISSSTAPSVSNPVVIDGSNASIAPFGIGSGDYKILVTSNKSLCGTVTYYTVPTIPNPTAVTLTSGSSPPSCFGGANGSINVSASGGTGSGYQYSKDGGTSYQTASTFSALTQGNYNIKVKDGNGCLSGVTPVSVTQPADISATAAVTSNFNGRDISCAGSTNGSITVNASGGTGTLQYSRDGTTYQSSNVFTSLGAGTYTITVRDANNCTRNSAAISLISPPALVITSTPPTNISTSCFGAADGSVTVAASGGTGALQYSINGTTFHTGSSFNGLNAGTYTITVRDINLCTVTQSATITQPLALLATGNASLVTCSGGNDGTVTITGTNGTAPYTYSFNGSAYGTSNNFTSLSANNYAISVKDSKGCIGNSNVTVTSNAVITGPITISAPISCNGGNNGALNLTPGGGVGPYAFNWSTGSTTEDLTNVIAGSYTVTITDSKSCSKAFSQTLTQPSPISIAYTTSDYNGFDIRCFGNTNGSINLTTSGGNGGYTYSWSNGSTLEDLSSLAAGTYTVNVLDSKSCPATQSVTLSQPTQLTSNQTLQNVLCFGGTTGGITFVASGGAGTYEYSINNGTSWQPAPVFSNLSAGNYQTTVRQLPHECLHLRQILCSR
jgi:SprB repeat